MERKINESFPYGDVVMQVVEQEDYAQDECTGCAFDGQCNPLRDRGILGECSRLLREDRKDVIFKEVQTEE